MLVILAPLSANLLHARENDCGAFAGELCELLTESFRATYEQGPVARSDPTPCQRKEPGAVVVRGSRTWRASQAAIGNDVSPSARRLRSAAPAAACCGASPDRHAGLARAPLCPILLSPLDEAPEHVVPKRKPVACGGARTAPARVVRHFMARLAKGEPNMRDRCCDQGTMGLCDVPVGCSDCRNTAHSGRFCSTSGQGWRIQCPEAPR